MAQIRCQCLWNDGTDLMDRSISSPAVELPIRSAVTDLNWRRRAWTICLKDLFPWVSESGEA
jgi:hypothetical protein